MKYTNLKDHELLDILTSKTQTERNLTLEIIELLEEVDQRKLFLERGFGSLLEFCIKELKYSESAAYRRISAMRVVRDVPEVKSSIQEGSLNLVNIAQAQTFINQERKYNNKIYTKEEKKDLILNLEHKSKRECEKVLIEKSPSLPVQEKVRQLTQDKTQITLTLSQDLIGKLDQLKMIYSHINPNATYAELIDIMANKLLKNKTAPVKSPCRPTNQRSNATPPGGVVASRYIPSALKHQIYIRDKGCCSYVDSRTKRRCESRYQLELDHKFPYALEGDHTPENLRLVCRNHNQFYANRALRC